MKKIINLLIFLIIINFFYSLNAVENLHKYSEIKINQLSEVPKNTLIKFHKAIIELCKSKKYFENIVNHKTYPDFGTKENWGEVCTNLPNEDTNDTEIKFFIIKNFKSKLLNKEWGLLTGYYEPTINISCKPPKNIES